jgi:EAL domain-containing protein (putative c-di-GMP-specific phosphodiesterase class I)
MKKFIVVGRYVDVKKGLNNSNVKIGLTEKCEQKETAEKRILKKLKNQGIGFIIDFAREWDENETE